MSTQRTIAAVVNGKMEVSRFWAPDKGRETKKAVACPLPLPHVARFVRAGILTTALWQPKPEN
jgi:hypothetical protein